MNDILALAERYLRFTGAIHNCCSKSRKRKCMKWGLLLVILFIATACCDDDNPAKPAKKANLLLAGELVEFNYGAVTGANDETMTLYMHTLSSAGYLRKELALNYFSLSPGIKKIDNSTLGISYTTYIKDGDIIGNFYLLDTTDSMEDYVNVLSYSPENRVATLELQASFNVAPNIKNDPSSLDTLTIGKSVLTIQLDP